jgi:hypothetical protein
MYAPQQIPAASANKRPATLTPPRGFASNATPGGREHGPERVQPAPRSGQGDGEWPEELDRHRDPERNPRQRW